MNGTTPTLAQLRSGVMRASPGSDWRVAPSRALNHSSEEAFFCAQGAARAMLKRSGGAIVTISSLQAFAPLARRVAYAAAKGGVVAMTRSLAAEWAPAEIASAVLFLASDEATYLTGETIMVDGGWVSSAGI